MAEYHAVCRADELAPGEGRLVRVGGRELALFNVEGVFYALENTCLHAGGPLHEGTLEGRTVTCAWHGWEFDVCSGRCRLNPKVSLGCYPVRITEGVVEIACRRPF